MAQRGNSSEKIKRMALALLGVILVVVFVYEIFLTGPPAGPKLKPQTGSSNGGTTLPPVASSSVIKRPTGAAAEQEALVQAMLSDLTPLKFVSYAGRKTDVGILGDLF